MIFNTDFKITFTVWLPVTRVYGQQDKLGLNTTPHINKIEHKWNIQWNAHALISGLIHKGKPAPLIKADNFGLNFKQHTTADRYINSKIAFIREKNTSLHKTKFEVSNTSELNSCAGAGAQMKRSNRNPNTESCFHIHSHQKKLAGLTSTFPSGEHVIMLNCCW